MFGIGFCKTSLVASSKPVPVGSDTYRVVLSPEGNAAFQAYLSRRGLKGRTRLLNADARQRFRFTSSVVQRDGRVECISQLHPLVRFAAERDLHDDAVRNAQAVAARVSLKVFACRVRGRTVRARGSSLVEWKHLGWYYGERSDRIRGCRSRIRETYFGNDLAEQMMTITAGQGQPLVNASNHSGVADAAATFRDVVQAELDQRFGDFVNQATAEIEDRVAVRHRALVRHFRSKLAALREHQKNLETQADIARLLDDSRRARNLTNLVTAQGVKIEKLERTWQLRESEIEAQRAMAPEESDICCLFLQVD